MPNAYAGGGFEQAQVKIIEERNWIDRLLEYMHDPWFALMVMSSLVLVAITVYLWRFKK
jgi:hypothetical protein